MKIYYLQLKFKPETKGTSWDCRLLYQHYTYPYYSDLDADWLGFRIKSL